MATNDFAIEMQTHQGATILTACGELDAATRPIFTKAVESLDAEVTSVVLDLTGLTYMDSSGVHVAQLTKRRCAETTVLSASPLARRIFTICGMGDLLAPVAGRTIVDQGFRRSFRRTLLVSCQLVSPIYSVPLMAAQ